MLRLRKQKEPAILAGSSIDTVKRPKYVVVKEAVKLLLFVSALAINAWILAPVSYDVPQGVLTYQLTTSGLRSGGNVQLDLGPFGAITFHTHKTPVNIKMNLVLGKDPTTGQTPRDTVIKNFEEFEPSAIYAFKLFALREALFFVLLGMIAGMLASNGGRRWHRQMLRNAWRFGLVTATMVLLFYGVTYATLNRAPEITYTGYSNYFMEFYNLAMRYHGGYKIPAGSVEASFDGVGIAARQSKHQTGSYPINRPIRLLAISDVHDNFFGMEKAETILLSGSYGKFSAVLLAGDIADFGQAFEADLFTSFAKKMEKAGITVYYVNGNHENTAAIDEFGRLGFSRLSQNQATINGLKLVGMDDPSAVSDDLAPDQATLKVNSEETAAMWLSYRKALPQVLVVHELAQAEDTIKAAKQSKQNLTVVYGHDHIASVRFDGTVNLVDCGTGGASGFRSIGDKHVDKKAENLSRDYTYQILDFDSNMHDPKLALVTTLEYDSLATDGAVTVVYHPVPVN